MKKPSRSASENKSTQIFEHFLRIPSLEFDSDDFPYSSFETSKEVRHTSSPSIPNNLMIGKQAEQCFEYYLDQSTRYDVLASNIQIQGASATMGELDYLVFDKELQQHLHIELACKFYLIDDGKNHLSAWIGPNRKDSLDQKLAKLQQKQFPLLFAEETSAILDKLKLDSSIIEQQLCLKAFLFVPWNKHSKDVSVKWQSSIVGQWMDLDSFDAEDDDALYALPKKTQWLLPAAYEETWISKQDLLPLLREQHQNKKTPLVYQKSNEALKLFFIVWWK